MHILFNFSLILHGLALQQLIFLSFIYSLAIISGMTVIRSALQNARQSKFLVDFKKPLSQTRGLTVTPPEAWI